ncbi:MAG: hypothetical protein WC677_08860 [Clostridia bacterium]
MNKTDKYRPSNGTEGEIFMCNFCYHCINEKWVHEQIDGDKKCELLNKMILLDADDKDYPEELTYDEKGFAICKSYIFSDWDNDGDADDPQNPKAPVPVDPQQLVLFSFDEKIDELIKESELVRVK